MMFDIILFMRFFFNKLLLELLVKLLKIFILKIIKTRTVKKNYNGTSVVEFFYGSVMILYYSMLLCVIVNFG